MIRRQPSERTRCSHSTRRTLRKHGFQFGDRVSWRHSETGRIIRGTIVRVLTADLFFDGSTVHATPEEPQYLIASDNMSRIVARRGSALTRVRGSHSIMTMTKKRFDVGDHVSWNSEAGRVSGHIIEVVTSEIAFKGYRVHASDDEPQYKIKSDRTDHIAMHKGTALRKVRD